MTSAAWHAAAKSRPLPDGTADRTLINNRIIMQDTFEPRTRSNKGWIVVTVIFLGLAYLFVQEGMRTGKVKNVFAAAPVATSTPAPAAIRAEPTIDYSAQIAAAEAGRYNAQLTAIAAKQAEVDAQAAQQAAQVVLIQITQAAEQNKIIAAQIEITRQANSIALVEQQNKTAALKIEQDKINAEKTPAAIQNGIMAAKAERDVKYGEKQAQADIFFKTALPVAIGFVGLSLLVWLGWGLWYARWNTNNPKGEQEEQVPEEIPAVVAPDFVSDLSMKVFGGIATFEQLRELARGVSAGVSLVHDNWTPATVLMSEGKFASLQFILVKYGRATWKDETHKAGIELTPEGCKFFDDVLNAPQTTAPLRQPVPVTPSGAGNRSIDSSFTPL
jgi:hypothetical protein